MHVLGTAGHVDHGKSTLITALTGIDPDRLAEEKARGLTIDLGFAWLTLPGGREIGIVDVPGHERFVHNMLAGVASIDATIFVVAANEGWMPQSEEHLQILDLLGARGGIVALTKSDTVDADALEIVTESIRERLHGTALHGAAVVPVSARTGMGLDALRDAIDTLLDRTQASADGGRPRLFVDRSFSIAGAGTVVTGTLTGGTIAVDDEIEILPRGPRARVRGIQTHRRSRDAAEPGSRVALNLAGLERHEIVRGNAVVRPGQWLPTTSLGVRIRAVRSLDHPVTAGSAYKAYVGSAETGARLLLLDTGRLRAGEQAFARLTLETAVVAIEGDRFVLRDTGRRETVAGGVILDAHPVRASRERALDSLRARDEHGVASQTLRERGWISVNEAVLLGIVDPPGAVRLRTVIADPQWLEDAAALIDRSLAEFHGSEPLARGMPRDQARRAAGFADARLFGEVLGQFPDRFAADGPLVRLEAHQVRLTPEQERGRRALLDDAAGLSPPSLRELESRHGAALVRAMLDAGDLVKVADDLVFAASSMAGARAAVAGAIDAEGPATTSQLRQVLGTSRKYAIPLLEHFDATGVTRRQGDTRSLR